jgi:hypothetical protein
VGFTGDQPVSAGILDQITRHLAPLSPLPPTPTLGAPIPETAPPPLAGPAPMLPPAPVPASGPADVLTPAVKRP